MNSNTNNRGISLSNAIASILCIGMLGALAIPGLSQLKQSVEPTLCSNNLKSCMQAWNLYASVSNGKWPATWDSGGNVSAYSQVPYIMWYFTKGEIPPGAIYDFSQGGWWNPYKHQYGGGWSMYGGFTMYGGPTIENNPVYHCPTTAKATDWESPFARKLTSYTQARYSVYKDLTNQWESRMDHYPQPELFTHSSTTFRIGDLAGSGYEFSSYNGWAGYSNFKAYNPHDGKGSYVFCDGHVELLTTEEFLAKGDKTFKPYFTGLEDN